MANVNDIVRVGSVTEVGSGEVKVQFRDAGIRSGWLKVLRFVPKYTENETCEVQHKHEIKPWMPEVGDNVLCLFLTGFNPDGYVIGGLN